MPTKQGWAMPQELWQQHKNANGYGIQMLKELDHRLNMIPGLDWNSIGMAIAEDSFIEGLHRGVKFLGEVQANIHLYNLGEPMLDITPWIGMAVTENTTAIAVHSLPGESHEDFINRVNRDFLKHGNT